MRMKRYYDSGSVTTNLKRRHASNFCWATISTPNPTSTNWLIMDQHTGPFCNLEKNRIHQESEFAVALLDAFPVAEGHTLVIPKRHVARLFDLSEQEQASVWRMVAWVRSSLAEQFGPDGYSVGVNDGVAAGQTIMHAHVHIIPRRFGDVPDPRGGFRWLIPGKAAYWSRGHA